MYVSASADKRCSRGCVSCDLLIPVVCAFRRCRHYTPPLYPTLSKCFGYFAYARAFDPRSADCWHGTNLKRLLRGWICEVFFFWNKWSLATAWMPQSCRRWIQRLCNFSTLLHIRGHFRGFVSQSSLRFQHFYAGCIKNVIRWEHTTHGRFACIIFILGSLSSRVHLFNIKFWYVCVYELLSQ